MGAWDYDNTPTLKSTNGNALFRGLVVVFPGKGKSGFRDIEGIVIGGRCKTKGGRIVDAGTVGFSLNGYTRIVVPIKRDGSFSATKKSDSDTSSGATFTVKGVFHGRYVSGTVTAHEPHHAVYGDCRATGKFTRAKGTRIA